MPRHVAIIMDGNGRWARQRGLPRLRGHEAGTENIRRVIRAFAQRDVRYLTLYAFSTENWRRPASEVSGLMRILRRVIERETQTLHREGVRLRHLGRLDELSPALQKAVWRAIELTKDNTSITVSVAFNYGGRAEILDAVKRLVGDGLSPDQLDEPAFSQFLYTNGLPDPDLIVRTAGEMRLSNFLIWQAAYAEYYSTATLWPDFDESEVDRALQAYAQRQRRFGGLT
ncbi:MAG: di-trans,poly-cis-decaprenylcistransferase [Chloroflexi bacterium]|nr:di-trans,poly-cis-decaprenylcistransferase [Chloroflexota bacterium]